MPDVIIIILILIALFIIIREVVMWYFKINKIVSILEDIRDKLN